MQFIWLTYSNNSRSNGRRFKLVADNIERMTPLRRSSGYPARTCITLLNGERYNVEETVEEIEELINGPSEDPVFYAVRFHDVNTTYPRR